MTAKRFLKKVPGTIRVAFADIDGDGNDMAVVWGEGASSSSARYILFHIDQMRKELVERGYDLTTLRFEIKKPQPHDPQP